MPRKRRAISITGLYHITIMGIDCRDIFLDNRDRARFIRILRAAKAIDHFELYGYCLMDNHVHLLIKTHSPPGKVMHRINSSYASYHNHRHGRSGPLFKDRFYSTPVDCHPYLLNVLFYIHRNALMDNVTTNMAHYPWCSFRIYNSNFIAGQLVDVDIILDTYFEGSLEAFKQMTLSNLAKQPRIIRDANASKPAPPAPPAQTNTQTQAPSCLDLHLDPEKIAELAAAPHTAPGSQALADQLLNLEPHIFAYLHQQVFTAPKSELSAYGPLRKFNDESVRAALSMRYDLTILSNPLTTPRERNVLLATIARETQFTHVQLARVLGTTARIISSAKRRT